MPAEDYSIDFIGLGAGKCGSTWLYNNLVKHPQICSANLKELNYFSDLYDEHPPSWYMSQFAGCSPGSLKGEFSVTYLPHPLAAQRIKECCPNAKLIAIVRDPVKRTFSNFLHSQRKGDLAREPDFAEYIEDEQHLRTSRYADLLEPYYELFPKEQVLVIVLEHFLADIRAGYRRTFEFLGVDQPDFFTPDFHDRSNVARSYRFMKIENILVQTYRWLSRRGYTRLVKSITDSGMANVVRKMNQSGEPPAQIDDACRTRLAETFRPSNEKLAAMLGEDLSCWSYEADAPR
jgi:hypothetical protein